MKSRVSRARTKLKDSLERGDARVLNRATLQSGQHRAFEVEPLESGAADAFVPPASRASAAKLGSVAVTTEINVAATIPTVAFMGDLLSRRPVFAVALRARQILRIRPKSDMQARTSDISTSETCARRIGRS